MMHSEAARNRPLLLIMYTKDMTDIIINNDVLLYADDPVLYRSDSHADRSPRNLQGDLNRLYRWCYNNRLTIDSKKN